MTPTRTPIPQAPDFLQPYAAPFEQLGLTAEVLALEPRGTGGQRPDARLRLAGAWGRGEWWVEAKARIAAAALAPVVHRLKNLQLGKRPVLLLTEYVTPQMADELRAHAIQFVDTVGNAFLEQRGLFVWVAGRRRPPKIAAARRDLHAAGLRLLFVLLRGRHGGATQRVLADEAGIALGGVGRILHELERRNWIRKQADDTYALQDPAAMLRRWDEGFADTLRPKLQLHVCRARPGVELLDLPARIVDAQLTGRVLAGGELGAAILTQHLKPAAATLHLVDIDEKEVMRRLELVPDRRGDIALLRNVGREENVAARETARVTVADPLLLHAELLVRHDDRLREIAELLRVEHIEPRWR